MNKLRTPQFDERIATDWLAYRRTLMSMYLEDISIETSGSEVGEGACIAYGDLVGRVVSMEYMAGMPLDEWRPLVERQLDVVRRAMQWVRQNVAKPYAAGFLPIRHVRDAFALLCAGVCLFERRDAVDGLIELCRPLGDSVDVPGGNALFDQLARAWNPDYRPAQLVDPHARDTAWTTPVLLAISRPPGQMAAALGAHMARWTEVARSFGWTARASETADVFPYMAYEVALSVCLYDVDDAGFRDHPCYPRDLVDHYRLRFRHTRDAHRVSPQENAQGASAESSAPPSRADLSNSSRQGLARWLELVCDGDEAAVERVTRRAGLDRGAAVTGAGLMCALVDGDPLAVRADIKDAQTLEAQLYRLMHQRGLEGFEPSGLPAAGPARAQALLLAFNPWASARGYRLLGMDLHDDLWNAVLVNAAYCDELLQTGQALGLPLCDANVLFEDAGPRSAPELFSAIVAEARADAPGGWRQLIVEGRVAEGEPVLPTFWARMHDDSVRPFSVVVPLSTVRALKALRECWFREDGGRWERIRIVYDAGAEKVDVDCDVPPWGAETHVTGEP